jgi:hypothetical protein
MKSNQILKLFLLLLIAIPSYKMAYADEPRQSYCLKCSKTYKFKCCTKTFWGYCDKVLGDGAEKADVTVEGCLWGAIKNAFCQVSGNWPSSDEIKALSDATCAEALKRAKQYAGEYCVAKYPGSGAFDR